MQSFFFVNLKFDIFDKNISHKLHIVEDNFPILTDGIIGRDILNRLLAKIDYETYSVIFVVKNEDLTIPMKTRTLKDFFITIPKRSETIHYINVNVKEDSLVLNKEIEDGIFVSNCIIPKEGMAHVKILNTIDKEVKLKNDIEPISNYICVTKIENKLNDKNRFQKILEILISIHSMTVRGILCIILSKNIVIFFIRRGQIICK